MIINLISHILRLIANKLDPESNLDRSEIKSDVNIIIYSTNDMDPQDLADQIMFHMHLQEH